MKFQWEFQCLHISQKSEYLCRNTFRMCLRKFTYDTADDSHAHDGNTIIERLRTLLIQFESELKFSQRSVPTTVSSYNVQYHTGIVYPEASDRPSQFTSSIVTKLNDENRELNQTNDQLLNQLPHYSRTPSRKRTSGLTNPWSCLLYTSDAADE